MGCSNPHPHCQIWASSYIPQQITTEIEAQDEYFVQHKCCMLCKYVKIEMKKKQRIIAENDHFIAVVPYWAQWPFEMLLLTKEHLGNLTEFNEDMVRSYADIMKRISTRSDNLFKCSFPYSMGLHQSPTKGDKHEKSFHFHVHYLPPLLRSASVKKFMVGFDLLGEAQRDITPEVSAQKLNAVSDTIHWKSY